MFHKFLAQRSMIKAMAHGNTTLPKLRSFAQTVCFHEFNCLVCEEKEITEEQ